MKQWTPRQIKSFRESLKLTQQAFGELLGVTRMHIYYIERGEKNLSKTLKLLLDCIEAKQTKKGE
ncbi:MAG: helix-turn-helix domain-containing protein [Candidatus Brocadiales bacterium]|nr:helix-turn-helix domain-containing protein [Candidatus Brocadiales bacterium]